MSKRTMDAQGGEERYGANFDEQGGMMEDGKPRQATAAQLARRKIIQPKGRAGSGRNSRQPSPAVASFTQPQSFQPPSSANGFNFSFNSNETPSFGVTPPTQNGTSSFHFGAQNGDVAQNGGGMFAGTMPGAVGEGNKGFASINNSAVSNGGFAATPTASFAFAQSATQPSPINGVNTASSNSFGGFAAQPQSSGPAPSFSFTNQSSEPKQSNLFAFGTSTAVPKPDTLFAFGSQNQNNKPPQTASFSMPPTDSSKANLNTSAPSLFSGASTAPSSGFTFGAAKSQDSSLTTPFAGFGQSKEKTNTAATNIFGSSQPASSEQPAFTSNLFSKANQTSLDKGVTNSLTQPQTNTPSGSSLIPSFAFGSTTSSSEVQQSSSNPTQTFAFPPSTSAKPLNASTSNFFASKQGQAVTETPFKFGPTPSDDGQVKTTSLFSNTVQSKPDTPPALFSSVAVVEDANMTTPEQTPQRPSVRQPSTTLGATTGGLTFGKSLFERMDPAVASSIKPPSITSHPTPSAASQDHSLTSTKNIFSSNPQTHGSGMSQPSAITNDDLIHKPTLSSASSNRKPDASVLNTVTADKLDTIKSLNEGFLAHLQSQTLTEDWTPICVYYMEQSLRISTSNAVAKVGAQRKASESVVAEPIVKVPDLATSTKSSLPPSIFNSASPSASSVNFNSAVPTTNGSLFQSLGSKTTQPTGASSADPPAPKSSGVVSYPQLSETASKTARLFASTLDKPANHLDGGNEGRPSHFGPPADVVAKVREDAAKKVDIGKPGGFNPATTSLFSRDAQSTDKSSKDISANNIERDTISASGLNPVASGTGAVVSKAPASGFTPSFGFQPILSSASTGAGNAFAAFAATAKKNEEAEKKKRKMEEYDSEEDDEAEWEAKDKAKQEEKKRAIEEAAKNATGFVFKPSATTAPPAKPLFDFGASTSTQTAKQHEATSVFAAKSVDSDKSAGEKAQGSGDHTWKPETPIKFAGFGGSTSASTAAPPANPFGGLFGGVGNSTSTLNKPAALASGFAFGNLAKGNTPLETSRTTTPGVTTDGETSNAAEASTETAEGEPSDDPKDKQIEDMTSLLDEEKADNEVLFSTQMSKAVKMDERRTEDGTQSAWIEKGKGPLYILKDKKTGRARVLLKVPPLGRQAMNFAPLKGIEYALATGKQKIVRGMFVDHLTRDADKAGKPSLWTIQVREPAEAAEIVRILNENR